MSDIALFNDDCLKVMPDISDKSINAIIVDLPYGTTQNKWDSIIPLDQMWKEFNRILKPNGAIVLTCAQPFTSILVMSNIENFKYEWIWKKTMVSGHLSAKMQPMRQHESVLVFTGNEGKENYYPVMKRCKRTITKATESHSENYGKQTGAPARDNNGEKYPTTVFTFKNTRSKDGHPTQKPIELMEYLINTYTKPGEVVLDNCMGSGTTGIAAVQSGRKFIGIEMDKEYFGWAKERIENASNKEETVNNFLDF